MLLLSSKWLTVRDSFKMHQNNKKKRKKTSSQNKVFQKDNYKGVIRATTEDSLSRGAN